MTVRLLTLAELAEAFQITEAEADTLRKRHGWPCVKVGRKNVRFTPEQVEVIIRQHTQAPGIKAAPAIMPTTRSRRS